MSGSSRKLKAGRVVQIRLNPKDCMAVVDIITQAKMFVPGMSFSHATSIAFACMSETFRKNNIVPTREGYEYSDLMEPFPDTTKGRGAMQFALKQRLTPISESYVYPTEGLEVGPTEEELRGPDPETHPDVNVRRLYHRLKELDLKRSVDPKNFDAAEFDRLNSELCKLI